MMDRWDFVNAALQYCEGKRYLEIGCHNGYMMERVEAEEKFGVEPGSHHEIRGGADVFKGTSDEYFKQLDESFRFDVIFIDGLHHCEQVFEDVRNSLKHVELGGAILLHDCLPGDEAMQAVPRIQDVWTGDTWKAFFRIALQNPDLPHAVANSDYGVGALIPKRSTRLCTEKFDWGKLTWDVFVNLHREQMNVLEPTDFKAWLRDRL